MLRYIISTVNVFIRTVFPVKKQYSFELTKVTICPKTAKHLVEVNVTSKGQSIFGTAQEMVADAHFINGFSPEDIKTITSFAITDEYETIFHQEKMKKSYEIIRSKIVDGKKTILVRNKFTGESVIKSLSEVVAEDIMDHLASKDAYYLGYLAGQEQTLNDFARLKLISSKKD